MPRRRKIAASRAWPGTRRRSIPTEAIAALERLIVSWRGDEVEVRTLGLLGQLYAEEGRWRDAFVAARNAGAVLSPTIRFRGNCTMKTARIFDEIFLGGRERKRSTRSRPWPCSSISANSCRSEDVADEIVRQLSNRLVENARPHRQGHGIAAASGR